MNSIKNIKNVQALLWDSYIVRDELNGISLYMIQAHIKGIEKDLLELYDIAGETDDDDRTGYETYGYEDLETIIDTLRYISDRWNARFRIKWLLDLLKVHF